MPYNLLFCIFSVTLSVVTYFLHYNWYADSNIQNKRLKYQIHDIRYGYNSLQFFLCDHQLHGPGRDIHILRLLLHKYKCCPVWRHLCRKKPVSVCKIHPVSYTHLDVYKRQVFKQNLGVSISDYIREKKIEKATHLLRYSDKAVVDIANYLNFSSQSRFIQIFENFTGLTPKKYRDKYYKSMW